MLTKLTKEQEELIPIVRDEWINLAYTHKKIDKEQAIKDYEWLYSFCGLKKPIVIVLGSPIALQIAANMVFSWKSQVELQVESKVGSQVWSQVELQVESQVGSQVWSQVKSQVELQVGSQVKSQVWSQVELQVGSQVELQVELQVGSQVWSQVWSQVELQVGSQVESQVKSQEKFRLFYCSESQITSEPWVSYYDYFSRIGIVKHVGFDRYLSFIKNNGYWMSILFDEIVFVCPPPIKSHRRSDGILHNSKGKSLEWEDGWGVYSLNGVSVPEWVVEMSAEKIEIERVVSEKNVEVRRELIRKIGVERFIVKAGAKVLDKKGDYELLSVKLSDDIPDARYLKMKNPSIGVWHVEGVEGNTVDEAIQWRAGGMKWEPLKLT